MRPTNSSPVVTCLLEAQGIVLGETNMEELAEGMTTINPVYGPVLNRTTLYMMLEVRPW